MGRVLDNVKSQKLKMLHFAPEEFFRPIFSKRFPNYETADLFMKDVDHHVDILNLPFQDGAYDFVYASHVLEHIGDDGKAINEIRRVLGPNGMAVLPVPIVCANTIEYPEANPHEAGHMRAPGLDYFEKYKKCFARVEVHSSGSFPKNTSFSSTKIEAFGRAENALYAHPCRATSTLILFPCAMPDFGVTHDNETRKYVSAIHKAASERHESDRLPNVPRMIISIFTDYARG